MSIPSSVREGPRTTNALAKKRYIIVYLAIITLSAQPAIVWFWFYWQFFPQLRVEFFIFFPLAFIVGTILLILSSIIIAKIFLSVINLLHKPKEGVFNRTKYDKDYCYWSLRSVVKKWPTWLARQLSLPIFETLSLKVLGAKTYNSSALQEGWVDCEFVEIGKHVKLGQGSLIISNLIVQNKLIIKKVIIKENVIIGAHSVISPGTIIEPNTILDAISMTAVNQHLENNSIYSGTPAKRIMDNKPIDNKEELEKVLFNLESDKYNEEVIKAHAKEMGVPYHVFLTSGWSIMGGSFIVPAFFFIWYFFGYIVPNFLTVPFSLALLLNPKIIIIMLTMPIILCGLYILHLFFVALFTRWWYRLADTRGPAQGIFDRNLDESSKVLDYYHFRSFLMKYPIFAFLRSPFPWLLNWELNFIKSNKVGKGSIFEECYIHSHLFFGRNCYMGTFAHISNHLVDGVFGQENLTFYGAEIGDNCVFNALIGGLPGLEVGNNNTLLPLCSTIKYDKIGNDGIYAGFPAKKLNNEEIKKILGGEFHGEE